MNYKLETIAFNIASCVIAQQLDVYRIELCDNPHEGGTTPSFGFINMARQKLYIKLYPIIRPRGGDFYYSADEFRMMKQDIKTCKKLGCDGVVVGMLDKDATIDKRRCSQLVEIAHPMGVTFHRAFDRVIDMEQALEDVIDIGCERILTSGLYPTVTHGADNIWKLVAQANNRIIIMPGSGVRASNIAELAIQTGAIEFHSSARKTLNSKMKLSNKTMNESLQSVSIDENEVKLMLENLSKVAQEK